MTEIYGYIYKIVNTINNKIYIGQTAKNPFIRKTEHLSQLKKNKHYNSHLQNAFNKYGEPNFKFTVLNYATDKKTLDQLEDDYIKYYNCLDYSKGYNLKRGGATGKMSLETRKKMSRSKKGKRLSKKHRENISLAVRGEKHHLYGKRHSYESIKKMRKPHKSGGPHSPETRKKISKSKNGIGLFGFGGTNFNKYSKPENKPWMCRIGYNGRQKYLGYFHDPLTCKIIHDLVIESIY